MSLSPQISRVIQLVFSIQNDLLPLTVNDNGDGNTLLITIIIIAIIIVSVEVLEMILIVVIVPGCNSFLGK